MKGKRFTDEQITHALRTVGGGHVGRPANPAYSAGNVRAAKR